MPRARRGRRASMSSPNACCRCRSAPWVWATTHAWDRACDPWRRRQSARRYWPSVHLTTASAPARAPSTRPPSGRPATAGCRNCSPHTGRSDLISNASNVALIAPTGSPQRLAVASCSAHQHAMTPHAAMRGPFVLVAPPLPSSARKPACASRWRPSKRGTVWARHWANRHPRGPSRTCHHEAWRPGAPSLELRTETPPRCRSRAPARRSRAPRRCAPAAAARRGCA